ncbi:flagellar protein FlaG [Clostridium niameyense]|uniref:flagellar protein FlaG n=1 Tax=Clostridium niameyense TaxID=1622073 RepID=UPI0009E39925|nr:flagellar protein FlaG [Clostridium niameyense]
MEVRISSQGRQMNANFIENNINDLMIKKNDIQFFNENALKSEKIKDEKIDIKDLEKAVDKLNKLLDEKQTHIEYEVYGKFKDLTIKIINNKTNEIIKEIPPKKIIDMVDKLCEIAGILIDQKA